MSSTHSFLMGMCAASAMTNEKFAVAGFVWLFLDFFAAAFWSISLLKSSPTSKDPDERFGKS